MLDAVQRAEQAVSEWYSQATVIRPFIALMGGPLAFVDAFFGTRGQNIASRRLQATVETILAELARIQPERFDTAYLESDDFYDVIWRAVQHGQRTRDQERVLAYAALVRGSIECPSRRASVELDLDLLGELTPNEFKLATYIAQMFGERWFEEKDVIFWEPGEDGAPSNDFHCADPFVFGRLAGKGILIRHQEVSQRKLASTMAAMHGSPMAGYRNFVEEQYQLSQQFRELLAYLQSRNESAPSPSCPTTTAEM